MRRILIFIQWSVVEYMQVPRDTHKDLHSNHHCGLHVRSDTSKTDNLMLLWSLGHYEHSHVAGIFVMKTHPTGDEVDDQRNELIANSNE